MPVSEKKYPEWVQAFRTKGTTVKKRGDVYYLYKRTSRRVPGKKYPQPVDTYVGVITPEGVVQSTRKKVDISDAEVWEYGFTKALEELCPQSWKEGLGSEWEDVFLHIVSRRSPRSYLLRGAELKDSGGFRCSLSAQFGLFSRRFYKEHGFDMGELECLSDIYVIYMDGREIISRISSRQRELIERLHLRLGV